MLMLTIVFALSLLGCSGNQDQELFETAELEELQSNYEHSKELYREIIEKYRDSQYANEARDRLSALQRE